MHLNYSNGNYVFNSSGRNITFPKWWALCSNNARVMKLGRHRRPLLPLCSQAERSSRPSWRSNFHTCYQHLWSPQRQAFDTQIDIGWSVTTTELSCTDVPDSWLTNKYCEIRNCGQSANIISSLLTDFLASLEEIKWGDTGAIVPVQPASVRPVFLQLSWRWIPVHVALLYLSPSCRIDDLMESSLITVLEDCGAKVTGERSCCHCGKSLWRFSHL